jgi:hypothetical protein
MLKVAMENYLSQRLLRLPGHPESQLCLSDAGGRLAETITIVFTFVTIFPRFSWPRSCPPRKSALKSKAGAQNLPLSLTLAPWSMNVVIRK